VPKILRTDLAREDVVMVLLYRAGAAGLQWHELLRCMPKKFDRTLEATLHYLEHDKIFLHFDASTGIYQITATGQQYVDERKLGLDT
jgi:hypothetical protein